MNTSKNLAFAINVNVNDRFSNEYINFHKLLEELTDTLPGFVTEGIGNKARKPEVKENLTVIELPGFTMVTESSQQTKRLIAVGLSSKYNVSLENENAVYVSMGGHKFPTIPVYDLKRDYNTILSKLKAYLKAEFKEEQQEETQVMHHGQFVRVGNQVFSHREFAMMQRQTVKNPRPANPTQRLADVLLRLLS